MTSNQIFFNTNWHNEQIIILFLVFAILMIGLILARKLQRAVHPQPRTAENTESDILNRLPEAVIIIREKDVIFANTAAKTLLTSKKLSGIRSKLEAMVDIYIRLVSSQSWQKHIVHTIQGQQKLRLESSGVNIHWQGKPAMLVTLHELPQETPTEETKAHEIVEESPNYIVQFDATGKISYCNPAAKAALFIDTTASESTVFDLFPANEVSVVRQHELPEAEKRGYSRCENTLKGRDGSEIPVLAIYIMHDEGETSHYSLIAHDMRQFYANRDRQERLRKAEAMNRLAGGIAYELNNALMVILGNCTLARARLSIPESASLCLDRIEETGRRMSQLCTQILAYAGRGHLELTTFDLNHWLTKNQLQLKRIVPGHIELHITPCKDELMVRADHGQMLRVLANVLKNSCEAINGDDGRITITTHKQLMDGSELQSQESQRLKANYYACLTIRDNGCGMDHHVIEHIFDPFFTTKSAERGMGMNVVQGIIQSHHGDVIVHSLPHEGAEVQLFLPLVKHRDPTRQLALPASFASSDTARGILIVEPNREIRELCASFLKNSAWRIYMADNRETALQAFNQHIDEIHCLMLDAHLPEAEQCVLQLRQQCKYLPVLLMSATSDWTDDSAFSHLDQVEYIIKPFDAKTLQQRLQHMEMNQSCPE